MSKVPTLEGRDLTKMWMAAPQWAVVVCIIAGFLYYLDRREQREVEREQRISKVSDLRIEQCHNVQEQANKAISDVAEALREQGRTLDRLQITIEAIGRQHHHRDD